MAKQPAEDKVAAAVAALDTVRRSWLRRPGVTAVDVGFKITDRELTDTLALRAHVERKLPVAELTESEVFNSDEMPGEVEGFPVDVIEATYGPSASTTGPLALDEVDQEVVNRRARTRPLVSGISVGNPRVTAGTLGAVVYDRATCQAMILSNFHVLAGVLAAAAGEPVLQPGPIDGGVATDRVATLHRFRIDASMDAAVATIDAGVTYDREVVGVGTITGTATPALGMNVVKSGRTTAVTRGIIDGVSLTVSINYGAGVGVVTLTNQVHIVPRPPWPATDYEVSMGGDSGSVWLEDGTRRAVGLHFAGETNPAPAAENAICTPIDRVVMEFNISFLPVLCRPPIVVDICRRYPALCRLLTRFPIPVPRPWPLPWPPFPGPGPIPGPGPGPLSRQQHSGCGCGGSAQHGPPELDEQAMTELAQLLTELQAGVPPTGGP